MGCKRLDTDFFDFLELVHSGKSDYGEKKRINYYPFGLQHKGYNNTISGNANSVGERFGFRGKELGDELGLDWYDIDARNYDPAIGRWFNADPLAEAFYEWSPYNFNYNNPIRFIDPTGLGAQDLIFKGDAEALEKVQSNLDAGLGGSGVATIGEDGKVTVTGKRDDLKTDEQREFFDIINEAADPVINVIEHGDKESEQIRHGNHTKETIDIDDINAFGDSGPVNQNSILGHEVKEQFEKQVGNPEGSKSDHHNAGKVAESKINGGYERQNDTQNFTGSSGSRQTRRGKVNYTTPSGTGAYNFTKGGNTTSVPFIIIRGNFQPIKD